MLIQNKERNKNLNLVYLAVIALMGLIIFKINFQSRNDSVNVKMENEEELDFPTKIDRNLYTDDLFGKEVNKIHEKDRLSLYLNKEFGVPTIMAVYSDSISDLEKNGRFLVFLHLKDPSEWRAVNKSKDHILLVKESLIPVHKVIDDRDFYIFKFGLEHPYFNLENLKKFQFVRHTREIGNFERVTYVPENLNSIFPVANSLDTLKIRISEKSLNKISAKRDEALESGILITEDSDFVKAEVKTKDRNPVNARIRLKGDWTDHLEHPSKWSYRIIAEGDQTVFGMRKLSVQHPKSRNYLWEWLFNKVVKDNGLLGLRYEFLNVDVEIKNKDSIIPMGIMALEESFDKILIENNQRREGIILCLDESLFWDERKKVRDLSLEYPEDANIPKYRELPVKVYTESKVLTSPVLSKQFEIAKNLIIGLRDNKLKLSDAFDVDKLTLYIALANLFGAHHGLHIENIKIYYNPVTNKLEPISFDSNSGTKIKYLREYPIGIHDDENYKAKLVEKFALVSSNDFINALVSKYENSLNSLALDLTSEFNDATLDLSVLEHNANLIKKKINPSNDIEIALVSYDERYMTVEIKNKSEFSVVIKDLVLANNKALNTNGKRLLVKPSETILHKFLLKEAFNNAFVSKKNKEGGFRYPKDLKKVQLQYNILGSTLDKKRPLQSYHSNYNEGLIKNRKLENQLHRFAFVSINDETKNIQFKKGRYTLSELLYIPPGYEVYFSPGFNLNLTNGASIISHSPIYSIGSEELPINIFSEDASGGGVFVSTGGERSELNYTFFDNLSVPKVDLWELSGAVNFNESEVEIKNCGFKNNRSEDALNLIRSEFKMELCSFENTFSDAFDGDFVRGSIIDTKFINSGNDGIDVSGSDLKINNVSIKNPSDKGLSAGESSRISGSNITVTGGEIGIVSKDLSRIDLEDVFIENTRLGVACFQKKSEFGPGLADLKNVSFSNNEVPYLIERTSDLILDNKLITDKTDAVIDQMYGKEYGKSSK